MNERRSWAKKRFSANSRLLKKIKAAANTNEWDELVLASIWPKLPTLSGKRDYSKIIPSNYGSLARGL